MLFFETGDDQYQLAGNGPVIVSKTNGRLQAYGSNKSVDECIADFERAENRGDW
jgi:hypothetical protein